MLGWLLYGEDRGDINERPASNPHCLATSEFDKDWSVRIPPKIKTITGCFNWLNY